LNLRQLRYLTEIARRNFNMSAAAAALHTSQPGMSKQIALLERELDVDILLRSGNRIVGFTEPGKRVMDVAQRIVHDAQSLKGMVTDFISSDRGALVIGTTHTHARYLLPGVVRRFKTAYPRVQLVMRLENEIRVAGLVAAGEVDIGIAAKPESPTAALAMLPCYEVPRSVFAPVHHPLLREKRLTLESIARYPIITFDPSFEGGRKVLDAFARHDIPFTVAMTASDVAVIKLYLELDIGVAILPTVAFEPARDRSLRIVDASRLV
jgi:LysR family cys regulon transcriptional activator